MGYKGQQSLCTVCDHNSSCIECSCCFAESKLGIAFAQLFLNAEQCSYLSRAMVATNHSSIFVYEPDSSCGQQHGSSQP